MGDVFTPQQKVKVLKLFNDMDDNNSGKISARELVKFCKHAGYDLDFDRAREIITENDDGSGKMDFEHFVIAIGKSFLKMRAAFVILAVFRELDTNNSGKISPADLLRIAVEYDLDLTPREIHEIIDRLDKSDDGLVSFGEFASALVHLLRGR